MMGSLTSRGQLTPITVVKDKERLLLVDGFKRREAALKLGHKLLSANLVTATPGEAKAMIYLTNRAHSFSMIQEALLVRDLVEVEGLTQVEVATLLERHKSWATRRLMLIRDLSPEIIEELKLHILPPGSGSSLARLHHDNQADFAIAVQTHNLKPRQIKKLVDLWCKSDDPAMQKWLLESPLEALNIARIGKKESTEQWLNYVKIVLENLDALNSALLETNPPVKVVLVLKKLLRQVDSRLGMIRQHLEEK